jgi:hypothetical protein
LFRVCPTIIKMHAPYDIQYIQSLYAKCKNFMNLKPINYCTFFHIHGRDYIVKKSRTLIEFLIHFSLIKNILLYLKKIFA